MIFFLAITVTRSDQHADRQLWLLPTLLVLFFSSGVSALIYQVLWLRLMALTFGVTTYAASTVWASFMAGLAIGSLAAGRIADRVRRPLLWFGAAELLVGVTALASPSVLALLQAGYVRIYPSLPDSLVALTVVRFAIAFGVLIVPTALMGATLPLIIKSSVFQASRLGERIALLYGTNTAGAIVGALAAGLWLIPGRGIQQTFVAAAALNVLVGLTSMVLGFVAKTSPSEASRAVLPARPGDGVVSDRGLRVVLAVFSVSGFISLALEVVWFRVLTLFLRPTVYGYAFMLATILAGIAIGSWLVTPFLDRRAKWLRVLALLEFALAVSTILSFQNLSRMSSLEATLRPYLSVVMDGWLVYQAVGSVLAIFPSALIMGVAFPIGLRVWTGGGRNATNRMAERIGVFYSSNVTGSILGSIAAGFFLLPALGGRTTLVLLAGLTFGSGLALLTVAEGRRSIRAALAIGAGGIFALALAASSDPFNEFVRQRYPREAVVWREEGIDTTVAVHRASSGEMSLSVNGNHQASTGRAMVGTHRSIGHLPMMVHPFPQEALVIGLGGGATAGAVSIHTGVDVDVVELSGAVSRAARYLEAINYGVLSRPNVHLRIDDGRNFMLVTRRKYDVITADVILPIYAGSGNLYSAEYFRLMKNVLKPGGIVLQWVAGTDAEYRTITRTFLSVFPETTAWMGGTLLIGSVEPLRLRRLDFERKLRLPGRADGARDLGTPAFEQLLERYVAGPAQLRAFVGDGPILTDDRPLVEYFLSLPRDRDANLEGLARDDVRPRVID